MIDKRVLVGGVLLVGGFLWMRRASAATVAAGAANPAGVGAVSSGVTSGGTSPLASLAAALLSTSSPAPAPTYTLQASEPAPAPAVQQTAYTTAPAPAPAPYGTSSYTMAQKTNIDRSLWDSAGA